MAKQQEWAGARMSEGARVVVMGHVHVPAVVSRGPGTIVHLGDWVEHRTWLVVENGCPVLYQGDSHDAAEPYEAKPISAGSS